MKPLIVLSGAFILSLIILRIFNGVFDYLLAVRIALAAMLLFTAIGHFAFPQGMAMMVPDFIPFKKGMVIVTGVFEILAAIGLLVPVTRVLSGWALIVFFILVLPANIHAALKHVDYQKGTTNGNGPSYLWFRVPLQILFIGLAYLCTV